MLSDNQDKIKMHEAIADIYQDIVDMGGKEFTRKYNQDCLKIKIVEHLYNLGYREKYKDNGLPIA